MKWFLLALAVFITIGLNEMGYGIISLIIFLPLSLWLMDKALK